MDESPLNLKVLETKEEYNSEKSANEGYATAATCSMETPTPGQPKSGSAIKKITVKLLQAIFSLICHYNNYEVEKTEQ